MLSQPVTELSCLALMRQQCHSAAHTKPATERCAVQNILPDF